MRSARPPPPGKTDFCASVAMTPQETTFIRIPWWPYSTETDFARFTRPALAAPYAAAYGLLTFPEIEPMLTIDPPAPCAMKPSARPG